MASASRGFLCGAVSLPGISMDGVIGLAEPLKILVFFRRFSLVRTLLGFPLAHVKYRLGHDIPLGGPVAEIAVAAAFTAKRKVPVNFRIGRRLANRTSMFHRKRLSTARDSPLAKSPSRCFLPCELCALCVETQF